MKRGGSSVNSYKNDETVSRGREPPYLQHQACQQRWNSGNQIRSTFSTVQLLWSIESERQNRLSFVSRYRLTNGVCAPSSRRGGSGARYAVELTKLLPYVARGLDIDWDEATRYAGLSADSGPPAAG